jgi:DNA-binding NtrC family response regulator
MSTPARPPRFVLVLNGMRDIVELFRIYLEQDGWSVISATVDDAKRGDVDLQGLIDSHDPAVVVFDVPPPYDVNWPYLQAQRTSGALRARTIVVTTTNVARLAEFVSTAESVIEVFGKPYDMEQVVAAVQRAAERQD